VCYDTLECFGWGFTTPSRKPISSPLLKLVAPSDGTLRRFLTDPSLYNHLDAACMLARILPHVDRMIQDFGVFADKLARQPEKLGLGGVVRPSNGLK
jgi:hypothetical protein